MRQDDKARLLTHIWTSDILIVAFSFDVALHYHGYPLWVAFLILALYLPLCVYWTVKVLP